MSWHVHHVDLQVDLPLCVKMCYLYGSLRAVDFAWGFLLLAVQMPLLRD